MTTDLIASAPRPFIRMSEGDGCGFRIGNAMLETVPRREPDMALRMGSALEPTIVQWLADQGLSVWFTGDDQLRLAYLDPHTVGHCDGLIAGDPANFSDWTRRNLPAEVQSLMAQGEQFLLEIKTMNIDSFNDFKRNGLTIKDALFRKYLVQINDYICTMNNAEFDEAWPDATEMVEVPDPITGVPILQEHLVRGSDSFRLLLSEYNFRRPESTLVVAFCTANKQYAFDVVPIKQAAFNAKRERLFHKIIEPMREGRMPEPDYDGHDPECYWCPVRHLCPTATSAVASAFALESIPLDAPPTIENQDEVDELLRRYFFLRDNIKELEMEMQQVRVELEVMVDKGEKYVTGEHVFHFAEVKGRKMLDTEALDALAREFNFQIPYKTASSHTRLYAKPLYGPSYDKKVNKE